MLSFRDAIKLVPDAKDVHLLRCFNLELSSGEKIPSVRQLAEALGFSVDIVRMNYREHGRLVHDTFTDKGFAIHVNELDDVSQRRWTLMHEIGHAYQHRQEEDLLAPALLRAGKDHLYFDDEREEEGQADDFAYAVFFGEAAMSAAKVICGNDVRLVAKRFGLPLPIIQKAMRIRW